MAPDQKKEKHRYGSVVGIPVLHRICPKCDGMLVHADQVNENKVDLNKLEKLDADWRDLEERWGAPGQDDGVACDVCACPVAPNPMLPCLAQ